MTKVLREIAADAFVCKYVCSLTQSHCFFNACLEIWLYLHSSRCYKSSPDKCLLCCCIVSAVLPLQSTLHLLLFLVGLLNLVSYSGQELLKVGQEVGLISPQLSPQATHLTWTGQKGIRKRQQKTDFVDSSEQEEVCFDTDSLLKHVTGPQTVQQHTEVPLLLIVLSRQLGIPPALVKSFLRFETGLQGGTSVLGYGDPPPVKKLT